MNRESRTGVLRRLVPVVLGASIAGVLLVTAPGLVAPSGERSRIGAPGPASASPALLADTSPRPAPTATPTVPQATDPLATLPARADGATADPLSTPRPAAVEGSVAGAVTGDAGTAGIGNGLDAESLPAELTPPPIPTTAMLDAIRTFRSTYGVPGLQVAILWPDGRAWTARAGFANVAAAVRPVRETPFSVGSITKTFVAALTLQLVDEGRFGLGTSVAALLPGVTVGGRAIDTRITVRQLLAHTSGLYDFFSNSAIDTAILASKRTAWSPSRSLSFALSPYFAPGAGWRYSNTNYVLLGLIAVRTTGTPLATLLRTRFVGPLGLSSTVVQRAETPLIAPAHAYTFASTSATARPIDQGDGTAVVPFTSVATAAGSAGVLASSAWDLARWGRALYGGRILPGYLLAAMTDASTATGGRSSRYGLGVRLDPIAGWLTYGHNGRLIGSWASLRYLPALGITIAVTTNQWRTNPDRLVSALVPLAVSALPQTTVLAASDPGGSEPGAVAKTGVSP